MNGFILIENYTMERAVRDAKVAYLARLIETGTNEVRLYCKDADAALATALIGWNSPKKGKMNMSLSVSA